MLPPARASGAISRRSALGEPKYWPLALTSGEPPAFVCRWKIEVSALGASGSSCCQAASAELAAAQGQLTLK